MLFFVLLTWGKERPPVKMLFCPQHSTLEVPVTTISQALCHLKTNLDDILSPALIRQLCDDLHLPFRERLLTPAVTTYLFTQQILHGNTAIAHLRHLAGLDFTDSAYCQARTRLPLTFFHQLQERVTAQCRSLQPPLQAARWKGHRLFLFDGSGFSMPDTPALQAAFGQPSGQRPGCGFPVAHVLTGFDAQTGFLFQATASPGNTHDLRHAAELHGALADDDVILGDTAFASYAHLALCRQRQLHALFPAHQKQIINFRPHRRHVPPDRAHKAPAGMPRSRWLKRLGKGDQLVEYHKPKERPNWMSEADYQALPEILVVREVRICIQEPGRKKRTLTLVTTLLDARRYSRRALGKLYGRRWQVEVNLRHLKQTLGLDVLRCQTLAGVQKELEMMVLVYNLVRRVMLKAAERQGVHPDRISFVDALRWLCESRAGDPLPRLKVNPERSGRAEPRVRKRRPKKFPLMTKPRSKLRKTKHRKKPAA